MVVFSVRKTLFLSNIAGRYHRVTAAHLQVWCCSLRANFISKLKQAGTFTCVGVPEPVRSQFCAVLCIFTRLDDAFAAIFIENCARRAAFLVKVAFARASLGIPVARSLTLDALATVSVELINGTRQWNFSASGSVWANALA